MRIPRFLALLSLALVTLCAASLALQYPFSTLPDGVNTHTFPGPGGFMVTVSGFDLSGDPAPDPVLAYKNDSSTEQGLGLVNDPSGQNEITGNSFIQLSGSITSLIFNSVQGAEGWAIFESNVSGSGNLGTPFATGSGPTWSLAGVTMTYVSVFATGPVGTAPNILVGANGPDARVPEPGTTAMIMTLGLVGLFEVGRRKLMA